MPLPARHGRLAVLLLVPAGVLAGHALGYGLAGHVPGPAHGTAGHLGAHPHGYLPLAMAVALPLAVLALLWSAIDGRPGSPFGLRRLVGIQGATFVLQEAVERWASGLPVPGLASSRALWAGLLAQLAIAPAGVLLIRAARATGARLVALLALLALLGRPVAVALAPGWGATWTITVLRTLLPWRLTPARAPPLPAG